MIHIICLRSYIFYSFSGSKYVAYSHFYSVKRHHSRVCRKKYKSTAIYGTKHYAIQSDHLNTPRRLIQSDGQVAWQWAYSAFGEEQPTIAKNRFANVALNQSFGSTTVTAVTFNLRYPGQYFDQESDLHYNYHRSYSARIGRYTQSDPIGLDGGWNRFGYVGQNPLGFTDPLGLQSIPIQGGYNPNDVRGGFDPSGNSMVYNPKYYDPSAASAMLLFGGAIIGAPCACVISGELAALSIYARLSSAELVAITRGTQTNLLSQLFKKGVANRPKGLTDEAIAAYKEIAKRIICEYEKTGNIGGITIQEARLKLLSLLN